MSAEAIIALHREEQKRLIEERAEVREVAKEDEERAKAAEERAKAADEHAFRNLMIEKELTEKKLRESPIDFDSTKQIEQQEYSDKASVVLMTLRSEATETSTPVVVGMLQRRNVPVVRDSGSNIVLVRQSMVPETNITGTETPGRLADGTLRRMPVARVLILTPYY
ncbi:hypothetical protein HPB49_011651 [Dermacentor silvarum]|uniref:Uncharacterized protein n=1 Tax=Dermacentor silvarum TaxID=543639 RepID=A0ACB8DC84_DERSI|nr:hypothetical protein HPB49_011651 [Dermacentor silvarum]